MLLLVIMAEVHGIQVKKQEEENQFYCKQRLQQLEAETRRFQQEQQESRDQMVELLQKFGSKVKKVEELSPLLMKGRLLL